MFDQLGAPLARTRSGWNKKWTDQHGRADASLGGLDLDGRQTVAFPKLRKKKWEWVSDPLGCQILLCWTVGLDIQLFSKTFLIPSLIPCPLSSHHPFEQEQEIEADQPAQQPMSKNAALAGQALRPCKKYCELWEYYAQVESRHVAESLQD